MKWKFKKFSELSLEELYGILQLRAEIFVVEQDCPYQDLDDKDSAAWHLFLEDNGNIVAYLRILPEGISYDEMAIGRVVVKEEYRHRGIAKQMMKKAIGFIVDDLNRTEIKLSGQAYLTDFYMSLGFKLNSDCYLEDGIEHFEFFYEV